MKQRPTPRKTMVMSAAAIMARTGVTPQEAFRRAISSVYIGPDNYFKGWEREIDWATGLWFVHTKRVYANGAAFGPEVYEIEIDLYREDDPFAKRLFAEIARKAKELK